MWPGVHRYIHRHGRKKELVEGDLKRRHRETIKQTHQCDAAKDTSLCQGGVGRDRSDDEDGVARGHKILMIKIEDNPADGREVASLLFATRTNH